MAITILRSTVSGHAPDALISGQIAINEADDLLFWRHGDGSVKSCKLGFAETLATAAPTALDTLKELADALGSDANFSATVLAGLSNRVRFDAAQTLTGPQKTQASDNLGIAEAIATAITAAVAALPPPPQSNTTGDIKLTLKTVADSGWVMFNDGSIGDVSSGASRANADTQALHALMYATFLDADCAIQTSAGAATTRAAQTDAATAWAARTRIMLPKVLGRALAISGSGSGLTARVHGHVVGEEGHQQTGAEMANHGHSFNDNTYNPISNAATGTSSGVSSATTVANSTDGAGGGAAANVMQPTVFLNAMVKL